MRRAVPRLLHDLAPAVLLAGFACAVTPLALDDRAPSAPDLDLGAYLLCAVAGLVFALRRALPVVAYLVALGCTAAFAVRYEGGPVFVCALATMPWLVASQPRRVWTPLVLAGAAVLTGTHALAEGVGLPAAVVGGVWLGTAALLGEVVRSRRAEAAQVRARAELAERRREEETLRRLSEERLRIAREVHDVVGHGLATITLHAGVAEHLLTGHPEDARRSIAAIREVSRTALEELRSEVGALREGDGEAAATRRPTPGLAALPELGEAMREAGIDVVFDLPGAGATGLPGAVQAAGYRIVREALTNVARHAGPGAHAAVRLAADAAAVELEVVDDGPGPPDGAGAGNGLTGMRERAAALGGSFEAGAARGGGFRVWARLPIATR